MSPIVGLTDRSPSFKEIGRLRLGIPKSEAQVSGPKEIGWFRADFRPDALDALALFITEYGQQPTSIHFRLPFAEISRCWDAMYECYNKFGMLGMADGKRWLYLRHNKTGELLVKDGVPTHADGTLTDDDGVVYLPFCAKVAVYSYMSKKGEEVKVFARPTGRLRILIPELKRAAYVQIITNSLYNCIHLSEQLAGVAEIAKSVGMSITQVPMTITRRKESISVSFNGHKQMQERYLLNIEIDPRWMEAQFAYMNAMLPGSTVQTAPQLSAGAVQRVYEPEELSEGDGTILEDEGQEIQPDDAEQEEQPEDGHVTDLIQQAAHPAQVGVGLTNGTQRPYLPETLKTKLLARAVNYDGKTATVKQRNLVAMILSEIFAGPESELRRHALQNYLFGVSSLKDLNSSLILVILNDWLKPVVDSGGAYHPDLVAAQEAQTAYLEAIRVQGQMALPIEGSASQIEIPF